MVFIILVIDITNSATMDLTDVNNIPYTINTTNNVPAQHIESTPMPWTDPPLQEHAAIITSIAIIIVNSALLAFFNKNKHKVWTTYLGSVMLKRH